MSRRECTGGKGATKVVQAICLFVFLVTLFPQRALRAETVQPHVVLLSIDGLRPDYYLHPDTYHLKIPRLRSLMQRGSYAQSMLGVYPTFIQAKTLWEAAKDKGLKTAIVTWPVSYGAQVDYLIPENLAATLPRVSP